MNLSKLIARKNITDRAIVTPNWFITGHWGVRYTAYRHPVTITPDVVRTIAPRIEQIDCREDDRFPIHLLRYNRVRFDATDWIVPHTDGKLYRMFRRHDHGAATFIDLAVSEAMELASIYGPKGGWGTFSDTDDDLTVSVVVSGRPLRVDFPHVRTIPDEDDQTPREPATLKIDLGRRAETATAIMSENLRRQTITALVTLTHNDDVKRHGLTRFLFGVESSKELTAAQCIALVDWIGCFKAGDRWACSRRAAAEARKVWNGIRYAAAERIAA